MLRFFNQFCSYSRGSFFGLGGGSIMMILFIIFIGYLTYSHFKSNNVVSENNSLQILKSEFAKGSISEDEYLRKKDLLK